MNQKVFFRMHKHIIMTFLYFHPSLVHKFLSFYPAKIAIGPTVRLEYLLNFELSTFTNGFSFINSFIFIL